jgi:phosphohistidine swiveling domain-containing protein
MRNWKKMLTKDANILLKSLVIQGVTHGPQFVLPEWPGFRKHLWIWQNGEAGINYLESDLHEFKDVIRAKALSDSNFVARYRSESKMRCNKGVATITLLSHQGSPTLTNTELNKLFEGFCLQFRQLTETIVMTLEELDAEVLTRVGNDQDLAALVTPIELSLEGEEELARVKLGQEIVQNYRELFLRDTSYIKHELEKYPELLSHLNKHVASYGWIPLNFAKPLWTVDFFIELFRGYARDLPDLTKRQHELESHTARHKAERAPLLARLDDNTKTLVNLLEATSYIRFYRASLFSKAFYEAFPILREVAKRLNISFEALPYFTPTEISNALNQNASLDEERGLKRRDLFVIRILDGVYAQYEGDEANQVIAEECPVEDTEGVTSVSGRCAYPGNVRGIVRIIRDAREIDRVQPGDILVCKETNPDIVIAMARAGAIVTDEGGLTCHAAIVSREMKKPCVVGTRRATKIFKDGDTVEVEAEKGIARKI